MNLVTRRAIGESLLWLALILSTFFAVFYFDKMTAALGLTADERAAPARTVVEGPAQAGENGIPPAKPVSVRLYADGHGHFEVAAVIGGHDIDFVIDTGATAVALSYEDARRLGLAENLKFTGTTITANGMSKVAPIVIPLLQIGDISVKNVRAHVAAPEKLSINLLGMSFIRRLQRFEMRGQELVLVK